MRAGGGSCRRDESPRVRYGEPRMSPRRFVLSWTAASAALAALVTVALPATGQPPAEGPDPELPEGGLVVDVDAPENALYKIAVADLIGNTALGAPAAAVVRNDLELISLFDVLPPQGYPTRDLDSLELVPGGWASMHAQGVVKGEVRGSGSNVTVEMRFYELNRGTTATVTQTYTGGEADIRRFMHLFGNKVVEAVTGEAAHFDTKLAYARRIGPGRKDVYCAHYDGYAERRVSNGDGIAMLPAFGPDHWVWYSKLTPLGMFITKAGISDRPIISGNGLTMSPSICDGRIYFSSTRDGNAEIYSSNMEGGQIRRLTNNTAIDVSPSCGPNNKIAFVSNRHGSPQIWIMNTDGSDQRRITFRGNHNQTPSICPLPNRPLIAFTGRQDGLDIFVVNYVTQDYTRITQGQGANKDPTFSPDCRMIAFSSSRRGGGIYITNPRGFNQNKVIDGETETLRWSR